MTSIVLDTCVLCNSMCDKWGKGGFDNPCFMPSSKTPDLLSEENIKATLQKYVTNPSPCHSEEEGNLVLYVREKASKVFLTLVMLEKVAHLNDFYTANFTDKDLPVHGQDPDWSPVHKSSDPEVQVPWECFRKLDKANRKVFITEYQWTFLAPSFSTNPFNYIFPANQPLPFIASGKDDGSEGGFGCVFSISILKGHHNYDTPQKSAGSSSSDFQVALKTLKAIDGNETSKKFYLQEQKTLDTMRNLNHPHLIRALAAYERGEDRGFLFPWADGGSLLQLWEKTVVVDDGLLSWALGQMVGIVDGIEKLHGEHNEGTRHGDIKPANILIFKKGEDDKGELKIADVGLAKYHTTYTRERISATTTNRGSRRYEPPEVGKSEVGEPGLGSSHQPFRKFSRKYDIWSLGCTFVEFLIWLFYGPQKLKAFFNECKNGVNDCYWEITPQETVIRQVITNWMNDLSAHLPQPSAWWDILGLIRMRLLVVEVESRANSSELLQRIKKIQSDSSLDSSYRFGPTLEELTRSRNQIAPPPAISLDMSLSKNYNVIRPRSPTG
ncbi:hypothetical protein ANO14919_113860 [Xylariales sp. No.14919]|nr:hypothetical protein ANO14919_113860 [Xylariales sp. No.14919]